MKLVSSLVAVAGLSFASSAFATDLSLSPGFTPDPNRTTITSGGTNPASSFNGSCTGWVTDRSSPDIKLNWNGSGTIHISATASADITLVVNDASGNWHCADDTQGTNPGLTLSNASAGLIEIWIGSYNSGEYNQTTVSISEIGQFQ
jgi:hypothetical protein